MLQPPISPLTRGRGRKKVYRKGEVVDLFRSNSWEVILLFGVRIPAVQSNTTKHESVAAARSSRNHNQHRSSEVVRISWNTTRSSLVHFSHWSEVLQGVAVQEHPFTVCGVLLNSFQTSCTLPHVCLSKMSSLKTASRNITWHDRVSKETGNVHCIWNSHFMPASQWLSLLS